MHHSASAARSLRPFPWRHCPGFWLGGSECAGPRRLKKGLWAGEADIEAAAVKEAAARLGKNTFIDDVRYRRIVGMKPAIWSREDVEYVAGLVSAKNGAGESPAR